MAYSYFWIKNVIASYYDFDSYLFYLLSIRWQWQVEHSWFSSAIEISFHEIYYFVPFLVISDKYFSDIQINRISKKILNRLLFITS